MRINAKKLQRKTGEEEGRRRDNGKSSVCNKRSRAAAIHNQSERVGFLSRSKLFCYSLSLCVYF